MDRRNFLRSSKKCDERFGIIKLISITYELMQCSSFLFEFDRRKLLVRISFLSIVRGGCIYFLFIF